MKSLSENGKILFAAFIVLACLHGVLVGTSRLFPFTDMPNHLAASTICRHYDDPSNEFSDYYELDLFPKPNIFHMLFCSLKIFPSVETANRYFLIISMTLLPLATLLLARKLGGSGWTGLLSFVLVYNYNMMWGFVGFTGAIPLVLFFYYFAVIYIEEERAWGSWAAAAILALLFFVHALAALFCILLYAVYSLLDMSFSRFPRRMTVVIPAAALLVAWWLLDKGSIGGPAIAGYLGDYYSGEYLETLAHRHTIFYLDTYLLLGGAKGRAVGVILTLCIVAPAAAGMLAWLAKNREKSERTLRDGKTRARFTLLACSLACFLFLPKELPGLTILYHRFSCLALISIIIAGSAGAATYVKKWVIAGVIAVCIFHFLLCADFIGGFNEENEGFTEDIFPRENDATLAGLMISCRYRDMSAYLHFPNYYIIWNQGIAVTKIVDYRFGAVRRKASLDMLPPYNEWIGRSGRYDGRYKRVGYLLFRGNPGTDIMKQLTAFRPVRSVRQWTLSENLAH